MDFTSAWYITKDMLVYHYRFPALVLIIGLKCLLRLEKCSDDSEDGEDTASGWKIVSFQSRCFVLFSATSRVERYRQSICLGCLQKFSWHLSITEPRIYWDIKTIEANLPNFRLLGCYKFKVIVNWVQSRILNGTRAMRFGLPFFVSYIL